MYSFPQQDQCMTSLFEDNVFKFESINIIQNYIPHPDFVIDQSLLEISERIEGQIKELRPPRKGPYISKLYGRLREEAYLEFEDMISEYSENKKKEYCLKFYHNVDTKCQFVFEKNIDLKELYRKSVWERDPKLMSFTCNQQENSFEDHETSDVAADLLKRDVEELSINWYLLVEKIVDLLIRCQLYKVKKDCIYRDISNRIKQQWWQDEKPSWRERLTSNWNLSLKPLKQVFNKNSDCKGEKMRYAEAMDCSDILVLITWAACGETVSKFFKRLKEDNSNKEILARTKGFLLLVTENLDSLLTQLRSQFEKCLSHSNERDLIENQQGLDGLIDELVNLRENVYMFETSFNHKRAIALKFDSSDSSKYMVK